MAYLLGDEDDALVEAEGEGARVGKPLEQQGLQQLAVGTDEEDGALRTLQRRLALVRGRARVRVRARVGARVRVQE